MPEMQGFEFLEHVLEVAERNKVRLLIDSGLHPTDAKANTELCAVIIPLPRNAKTYAIALHEIGHVVHPEGSRKSHEDFEKLLKSGDSVVLRSADLMMKNEDAAWAWAKENAKIWTPEMDKVRDLAQKTYAEHLTVIKAIHKMFEPILAGGVDGDDTND